MELEKFIEHIKLNKHLYYEEEFERIVGFLEELKTLRVELEKNSKGLEDAKSVAEFQQKSNIERSFRIKELEEELKVYKKVFEMACGGLEKMCYKTRHCDMINCPMYDDCVNDGDTWQEYFLQKAREEKNE